MSDKRMKWVKSLRVGDVVCDCRYRHLAIKKLKADYFPWMPWIIRQLIFADWMPDKLADWLDISWEKVCYKLRLKAFSDYYITFEDGTGCSAFNCCGPVDHNELDHPPPLKKESNVG